MQERTYLLVLVVLMPFVAGPASLGAQSAQTAALEPEIFGGVAAGHLSRAGDGGSLPSVGAGVRVTLRSGVALEVEVNRTIGALGPPPDLDRWVAVCGANIGCVSSVRTWLMKGTLASANVLYVFSAGRVQPYAVGGLGKLWVERNRATIMSNGAGVSESRQTEGDLGYLYGGGVRMPFADHVSIRFEFKHYKGIEAPSLTRVSTSFGYRW